MGFEPFLKISHQDDEINKMCLLILGELSTNPLCITKLGFNNTEHMS